MRNSKGPMLVENTGGTVSRSPLGLDQVCLIMLWIFMKQPIFGSATSVSFSLDDQVLTWCCVKSENFVWGYSLRLNQSLQMHHINASQALVPGCKNDSFYDPWFCIFVQIPCCICATTICSRNYIVYLELT